MKLEKVNWMKVAKVGACVVAGVISFATALGDQKKEEEFELLKKTVSELKGKES